MIKIRVETGDWQNFAKNVLLIHEDCPNTNCEQNKIGKVLYYPHWYKTPTCNKCKAPLLGSKLIAKTSNRIDYHLAGGA